MAAAFKQWQAIFRWSLSWCRLLITQRIYVLDLTSALFSFSEKAPFDKMALVFDLIDNKRATVYEARLLCCVSVMAFDFFEKKVNQFVTYNSGGRESQIDLLMCRRCHLKEVINCKVINWEAVAAQHIMMLVMDWEIQRGKKRKPEKATPRIKWWRLKEDDLKVQFREKVLDKVRPVESVQDDIEIRTAGFGYDN